MGLGGLAHDVVALLPGFVLFGCGFAAVLTTLTTTVMAGAGEHDRGMISGVFATARNVGASLGVAVTGAVLFALPRTTSYDDAFAVAMFVAAAVAATGAVAAPAIIESRARRAPA